MTVRAPAATADLSAALPSIRPSVRRLWQDESILVHDVSAQPLLTDRLRISVGTPADTDALITGLRRILGGRS